MYASPGPRLLDALAPPDAARPRPGPPRNAPTSVVLPTPGSPLTNTSRRSPSVTPREDPARVRRAPPRGPRRRPAPGRPRRRPDAGAPAPDGLIRGTSRATRPAEDRLSSSLIAAARSIPSSSTSTARASGRPRAPPPAGPTGRARASAARGAARAADARPRALRAPDEPRVPAERELGLDPLLERPSRSSSSRAPSTCANARRQLRERRPTPERERLFQQARRAGGVGVVRLPLGDQPLEAPEVDRLRRRPRRRSPAPGLSRACRQAAACAGARRRPAPPSQLSRRPPSPQSRPISRVARDPDAVRVEEQEREQRALLARRNRRRRDRRRSPRAGQGDGIPCRGA